MAYGTEVAVEASLAQVVETALAYMCGILCCVHTGYLWLVGEVKLETKSGNAQIVLAAPTFIDVVTTHSNPMNSRWLSDELYSIMAAHCLCAAFAQWRTFC